ncbi:MAG: hypothetical protein KY467_18365 [Gemmatimonadetes bacterium]|nr:hypothetical protein [Gemmatimonadota bacterium]
MLIDDHLPAADFAERHALRVHAPPERVYAAARRLDLGGSLLVRTLFALRSLPGVFARRSGRGERALGLTMEDLLRSGFVLLDERPPHEFVLGLVGRFWTPAGGIERIDPAEFAVFARPGMAVAAWNFTVLPTDQGSLLATETRVRCTDNAARRSFARYWRVVRPFSGLIRMEALRAIRRTAEASAPGD